jgi:hypothetical protein
VEENKEEPRLGRFCITRTWFAIWAVSSSIVILACYLVRPYVGYEDEFSVLVNAINVISYILIVGLPVFLSTGIVFGTSAAKTHILTLLKSGRSRIEVFLRCLSETYALIFAFSVTVTGALFLIPYLSGTTFYEPRGTGFLIYFPSVLIATLVVSLLLGSIGVFFVSISDDVLVSTSMGCAVTFGLATMVGYAPGAIWASVTRSIAMMSPSSIVRVFAGSLSGYSPTHGTSLASYFGFDATMGSIFLVLAELALISLAGLFVGFKLFKTNTFQWSTVAEIHTSAEVWESELERQGVHTRIRRSIRIRRAALVALVTIVLVLGASGTAAYSSMVVEQTTVVFYRSAEGGEPISLGEWYIFPCNVQPSSYGQRIFLRYECLVEEWGSAPEEVSVYYSMLNMSSSDFQILNETDRRALCNYHNRTEGDWGGVIGGISLEFNPTPYVFVMKFIAAENETLPGFMYFWIELLQKPW